MVMVVEKMNFKRDYRKKSFINILLMSLIFPATLTIAQQPIQLLVRADDMGKTYDVNLAIIKAHKEGIVTSAGIMPGSAFFEEAVRLCKENPTLTVGIHITLLGTRERPVLSPNEVPSIVNPNGFFYENREQLEKAKPKAEEIEKEIRAQVGKVMSKGLHVVYIDFHRNVPQIVRDIIIKVCDEEKLIYGQVKEGSNKEGDIYGYKRITIASESWPSQKLPDGQIAYYAAPALDEEKRQLFYDILTNLKPGQWLTVVHPGLADPQGIGVTELLCAPETKEIIKMKNIQLVSYYDLWEKEFESVK